MVEKSNRSPATTLLRSGSCHNKKLLQWAAHAGTFCLGMVCMYWWSSQQASPEASVPPTAAAPSVLATHEPAPPITFADKTPESTEQAVLIAELQSTVEEMEQQIAAYQAELIELQNENAVEDETAIEFSEALIQDLMKKDFALQVKTGITPEQQHLLDTFIDNYRGPVDEFMAALEAYRQEILSTEQIEATEAFYRDLDDATRINNATSSLSELQTLFDLS